VTVIGDHNRRVQAQNQQREKLREEQKVVAIDVAREQQQTKRPDPHADYQKRRDAFLAKRMDKSAPPQAKPPTRLPRPADDAYAAFYREAQERRRAVMAEMEARHGAQERQLEQNRTEIEARQKRNLAVRVFRTLTGATRRDRAELKPVGNSLREIEQQRQAAYQALEKNRQKRLEALQTA
jgi:hypothetical protein